MAKKTKNITENIVTEHNENINDSNTAPQDTENSIISNYDSEYDIGKITIRELLELSNAALILGKKYENLSITEGGEYFLLRQTYKDFYNKVIDELENRVKIFMRDEKMV